MSFDIQNLFTFKIGGIEVWITETQRSTWVIMGALILLAIAARVMLKRFDDVPKGFQNFVETIVEAFDNFLIDSAGAKLQFLGSWFFAAFSFILLSNLLGLLTPFGPYSLRNPTADWTVTVMFALVTFVLIQAMGVKFRGRKYIKSLFEPNPVFFILNAIGELARPVSLSFRLFGNIVGGMILMGLLYEMAPIFVKFVAPSVLHFYFDLFSGAIQAYIFCILSLAFIGTAAAED